METGFLPLKTSLGIYSLLEKLFQNYSNTLNIFWLQWPFCFAEYVVLQMKQICGNSAVVCWSYVWRSHSLEDLIQVVLHKLVKKVLMNLKCSANI